MRQAVGEDKAAQDKTAQDGSEAPQRAHMCDTERLCVRKSLLAGAGCGLFVKTLFFKGEVVCDYKSPEVHTHTHTYIHTHKFAFTSCLY